MPPKLLEYATNYAEIYVLGSNAHLYRSCVELVSEALQAFTTNLNDFGLNRTLLLYTLYPKAHGAIQRIRVHVLRTAKQKKREKYVGGPNFSTSREALALKDSYTASLSMIAVAGAIAAQIAITALSLANLDRIHWTAEAAFVVSLVAGLLSVYYACIVQVQLGGMHAPEEVLRWLTTRRYINKWLSPPTESDQRVIPSYGAAIQLAAPIQLLNWSLFSLLVGIGIYYGLSFAERLATRSEDGSETAERGRNADLALLIVYVAFAVGGLMSFVVPTVLHLLERTTSANAGMQEQLDEWRAERLRSGTDVEGQGGQEAERPAARSGDMPIV